MQDYKCRNNIELGCGDTCCKYCAGASECRYACKGRPDECGLSVVHTPGETAAEKEPKERGIENGEKKR